jgi:transitional endoplasmic reticulum ATPase
VEPTGNGILMHGEPGNGKTGFAEALVGELQVPLVTLTYGDVASKWLGEVLRVLTNCFAYAKAHAPCVLFIDEVHSFLRSRDSGSNNSEDLKVTNTLLTQMVELRNHQVVLVAATNFLSNPGYRSDSGRPIRLQGGDHPAGRTRPHWLLQKSVAKYAGHLSADQEALRSVAKRWSGFPSAACSQWASRCLITQGQITTVGFDNWMGALRLVQGRKGRPPAEAKPLKDLILESNTRDALD